MSNFDDQFSEVENLLRGRRETLAPLEQDRIKLRAMSQAARSKPNAAKGTWMKRRLTVLLTCAFVGLSTPAALACFGGGGGSQGGSGGGYQYRPPCNDGWTWSNNHCVGGHQGWHWQWLFGLGWLWNGLQYLFHLGWCWIYAL
jgi:hypothetical protein